jgi:rod shape determining protein RodA
MRIVNNVCQFLSGDCMEMRFAGNDRGWLITESRTSTRMLNRLREIPWGFVVTCAAITIIGLCGLVRADQLYGSSRLFERQIVWLILSWPAMLVVTQIPYRSLRPFSMPFYLACVVLLVLTLFMPPVNGSRRWIPLGLFDFQPSEPARLAFILALAFFLMHRENYRSITGLLPPLIMTIVPLLLILKEPDLGTAMLFLPVMYAMIIAAGARMKHIIVISLAGLALVPVLWWQMSAEQRSRVVTVFTQRDGGPVPSGDGFHLHQSKQVLALGGAWGSIWQAEPPTDDPAAWQLPAARTDFIFCMIGERYGIPGCILLLSLYAILVVRGLLAAIRTREPFGRLVAIGIVAMLATQVVINTGMTVGLMPITGITLPLCSYGGSSLLSTSIAMGLLINISMRPGYEVTGEPFVRRMSDSGFGLKQQNSL